MQLPSGAIDLLRVEVVMKYFTKKSFFLCCWIQWGHMVSEISLEHSVHFHHTQNNLIERKNPRSTFKELVTF